MGRASKFSFPIPGRRHAKKEKELDDTSSIPSVDSHYPEYTPRAVDPSQPSKAERLLGASGLAIRQHSQTQPKLRSTPASIPEPPQSPGYMTVTVSEASFGSDCTEHASSTAAEDVVQPPRWQSLHPRPSSNLLGSAYSDDRGRAGSIASTVSKQIHGQASTSTLRSFYDAQNSPLAVSQQTSASAVRDMALRKGQRSVQYHGDHASSTTSLSSHRDGDAKQQVRKSKPPRLDLSRLFPKPRGQSPSTGAPLLSPSKLVNSPMPISAASEYFPRHPVATQREMPPELPAPSIGSIKLAEKAAHSTRTERPKDQKAKEKAAMQQKAFRRDVFDNAKVNVRRPPRGIQHWFEGLDEEDEDEDDVPPTPPVPVLPSTKVAAPVRAADLAPIRSPPNLAPLRSVNLAPARKSSLGRVLPKEVQAPKPDRTKTSHLSPATQMDFYKNAAPKRSLQRLRSASQQSVDSQITAISSKSKFSSSNLQDSSVLSMSSSDEEDEAKPRKPVAPVRDSLAVSTDNEGEIIIGKAQAFEVKPRQKSDVHRRVPSENVQSRWSASTSAATIEVMYSPDPNASYLPRHSRSKASRHTRQPSSIPEHETRPRTADGDDSALAAVTSPNASPRSARTSRSEPRSRSDQHKLMAVTEEEEALLEMMRRKRAAMAKHSFSEGYKTALTQTQKHGDTPTPKNYEDGTKTSAFLLMDSPSSGKMKDHPTSQSSKHMKQDSVSGSETLTSIGSNAISVQGRPAKARKPSAIPTSILRDPSSSDFNVALHVDSDSPSQRYQLAAHVDFSPLDARFPSTPTSVSIASPTTASHASPLPSPVTPGPRHGESDLIVKVAGSEPSLHTGDEELIHNAGSVEPFMTASVEKLHDSHRTSEASPRARRRTASSGADVVMASDCLQSQSSSRRESQMSQSHRQHAQPIHQFHLHALDSLDSSDTPELYHSEPKSARTHSSRRTSSNVAAPRSTRTSVASSTSPSTAPTSRSVRDSRISKSSRLSRENSLKKRESSMAPSTISTRCSVSDDVLAAWGSLGGWRTFEERA